ncbi:hypothetical protein [Halorientalis pallida]|uniref:hypothetical protein n=1 Tax=Halorientalis pallida TaxID=2479928 RepID=UPI001D112EF8|nr:hypothetical protein [Halorientalis pallida]
MKPFSPVPLRDAASAAADVPADATMLVSGFGSVGEDIDVALVQADAIARRFPYQTRSPAREAANDGRMAFADRHISTLGDDVQFGGLVDPDVAVVEAVAVGEDWLIPSGSVGHTPASVESADSLIVEVNHAQPRSLAGFHDIYRPELPPERDPVPLSAPVSLAIGIAVQLLFLLLAVAIGFVSVVLLMSLVTLPVWIALIVFDLAWGTLGVIAVGRFVANRAGRGGGWVGLLVGAIPVVVLQAVPFGVVPMFLIVSLGMGGAVRPHMGVSTSDRSVPSGRF